MNLNNLLQDPVYLSSETKPSAKSLLIDGQQGHLLSLLYLPGGEDPHPAVLLCHGYPGTEQNLDLAQALRRIGFAVMTFHYAGSWNSEGSFSLTGSIRDAESVLDAMISHADDWKINANKLFIVGHSMGGLIAAHLLSKHSELDAGVLITPWDAGRMYLRAGYDAQCCSNLWEVLSCGFGWLKGISHEGFEKELHRHARDLSLEGLATKLAEKEILCIAAEYDEDTPIPLHTAPLCQAMESVSAKRFFYYAIPTDHSFNGARLKLIQRVAEFLCAAL